MGKHTSYGAGLVLKARSFCNENTYLNILAVVSQARITKDSAQRSTIQSKYRYAVHGCGQVFSVVAHLFIPKS